MLKFVAYAKKERGSNLPPPAKIIKPKPNTLALALVFSLTRVRRSHAAPALWLLLYGAASSGFEYQGGLRGIRCKACLVAFGFADDTAGAVAFEDRHFAVLQFNPKFRFSHR